MESVLALNKRHWEGNITSSDWDSPLAGVKRSIEWFSILRKYKFVDLDARKVVEISDEIEVFSYVLKDVEDTVWSSLFLSVSFGHWRRTKYERDRTLFFGACPLRTLLTAAMTDGQTDRQTDRHKKEFWVTSGPSVVTGRF